MNKKIKLTVIVIILFLLMFFLLIRLMIVYSHNTVWRHNSFCRLKYGLEDRGSEQHFGRYCAYIDYENRNITKYYYTTKEMMDYCGRIGFWEFNKWEDKCSS